MDNISNSNLSELNKNEMFTPMPYPQSAQKQQEQEQTQQLSSSSQSVQQQQSELNISKIKYMKCNNDPNHEDEQMNLVCVDPSCPEEDQFTPFCSLCQDENNIHNRENHKSKNLKTVLKSIQQEYQQLQQQKQEKQNYPKEPVKEEQYELYKPLSNSNLSEEEKNQLLVAQDYQEMSEQLQKIADFIKSSVDQQQGSDINEVLYSIQQAQEQNNFTQNLKQLRSLVVLDEDQKIRIQDQKTGLDTKYIEKMKFYAQKFLPHIGQCYKDSEKLNDHNNNYDQINNLNGGDNNNQQNQFVASDAEFMQIQDMESEIAKLKHEVERYKQQNKNTQETLEMWKQKYKKASSEQGSSKNEDMDHIQELVNLKQKLEIQQDKIEELSEQKMSINQKLDNIQISNMKLKDHNKILIQENSNLTKKLNYIQKQLNEDEYTRKRLQQQQQEINQRRQQQQQKNQFNQPPQQNMFNLPSQYQAAKQMRCQKNHILQQISPNNNKVHFSSCQKCFSNNLSKGRYVNHCPICSINICQRCSENNDNGCEDDWSQDNDRPQCSQQ